MIELANSIFGFNGWSSSIVDITPDFVRPRKMLFNYKKNLVLYQIEESQGKFRVGVTAVVKVSLKDGTSHEVIYTKSFADKD